MAKVVAKVYGDALFSLAVEEGTLDSVWEEIRMVRQSIEDNPEFLSILCHPEMMQRDKLAVLDEVFDGKVSKDVMGFLNVLVRKGRFGDILSILDTFEEQAREYKKIGVVYVSTPTPLSDGQKEKVENRLLEVSRYETLEMNYQVDESLLGGMVIRIGDRVLDNSIRSKMDAMSRQLSKVKLSG